jgi:hypothetical protein
MLMAVPALCRAGTEPQAAPAQTTGVPDFSGHYTLNAAQSDDARQKLPSPGHGGSPGERPARGGGGGGYGGRHHGGMGPGGGQGDDGRDAMHALFEAPKDLSIIHTANEIAVMEEDGRLRTLHPDGKSYKSEGGANEVKTRWDGTLTTVSRLAPASREPVEIRRVYDPEAEGYSSR